MLIDTHCHLTYPGLAEDMVTVVHSAFAAGVERMITVGTHPEDHTRVIQAIHTYSAVYGAIGIHPNLAPQAPPDFTAAMQAHFSAELRLLAVGECGLDYHYGSATKAPQARIFSEQLQLARQLRLPVILHVREAHADTLAVMADFPDLSCVVHCFTGTPREARQWLDRGAYVGITGIVTYKNAPDVRAVAKLVPDERLLVETDSPYLSPEPVRKIKNNQPAFVVHVATRVAAERGTTLAHIAALTTANARRLFGMRLA